ncbi:hypothetical protein QUV83_10245 [Cellulomonas cellasea]|uniref:hypothetical protein n=1 Tax=Cellulomonas cellasea TaxID=43670 RepID=UPI0025A446E0|nr:hypothetical protein [Cellulomonas cellasea]MDM8085145.1 hypothetical protein [Cellulomonas cellasea]
MTTAERPWLRSLPTRVEMAESAVIEFEEHGQPGIPFSQAQIDRMFKAGLMQPPRTSERDPGVPAGVTLTGDARFLVGEVDLGPEVGMEVLTRGFEAAVDALMREHRDRHPLAPADENEITLDDFRDDDARQLIMTMEEAVGRWDELRPRVALWDRIVLTEDGERVAVIVAWDWWSLRQECLASLTAIYWAHWHTGTFDAAGYAHDALRLLAPRDARIREVPDPTETVEADGDDD